MLMNKVYLSMIIFSLSTDSVYTLDHSTDIEAVIQIDLSMTSEDTISPNIYGGFIEFIGQTINGKSGLWAQDIESRGFETQDTDNNGIADEWIPFVQGDNKVTMIQDTARANKNGSYSQKIEVTSYNSGLIGIVQPEKSIKSRQSYDVQLYLKGSDIDGRVTVWLIDDTTTWNVSDSVSLEKISGNWEKYEKILTPETSFQDGFFAITFEEQGILWIDEVSLMAQNAVDGVRKTYIELIHELKPNIMRYPGGSFADGEGNHWLNGIGDMDQRPPNWDNYFETWQRLDFGTDEFINFCNYTDMEPQITVNFGSGTPEEAAKWVEYTNGAANTRYGRLREKLGHKNPYNIRYWEIGNEQYRELAIGHVSAEEYANRFIEYTNQMKTVDPTIKVIANGCRYKQTWNDTLLSVAGNVMDYISLHLTCPDLGDKASGHTDEDIYKAVVAGSLKHKALLDELKTKINETTSGNVKFALTELWMTFGRNPLYGHHDKTLETALYIAGMLNLFQQYSHMIDIANWTTVGKIKYSKSISDFYKTPEFHTLSLYSNHSGNVPVTSVVDCSTYTSPRIGSMALIDSVPILDVSVTRNDENLFINTVNRSLKNIKATIDLHGENITSEAIVRTLNGPDFLSKNHEFPHNQVFIDESYLKDMSQNFIYTFPAHSVTGIELTIAGNSINEKRPVEIPFLLGNACPNPFNSSTIIFYHSTKTMYVNIQVLDIRGRKVRDLVNEEQIYGRHSVIWDGRDNCHTPVSSGVYLYRFSDNQKNIETKKLVLLK
jgi:alpha-N-arabinofuranosidase